MAPNGSTLVDVVGNLPACDFNPPQVIGCNPGGAPHSPVPVIQCGAGQPGCILNPDTNPACAPFTAGNAVIPDVILTDKGGISYSSNTPQSYRINQLMQMGVTWFSVPGGPRQNFSVAAQAPAPVLACLPVSVAPVRWLGGTIKQGPIAAIGTDLANALPQIQCGRLPVQGIDPVTKQPTYPAPCVATVMIPATTRDGGPVTIAGCSGIDGSVPNSIAVTGSLPPTIAQAPVIASKASKPTTFFAVAVFVAVLFLVFAFSGKVIGDL